MPSTLAREAAQAERLAQVRLTAVDVIDEIRKHAFSNVKDLFDEHGNLKPIHLMTREQAACIASFEVVKKNAEPGDGKIDLIHKVKTVEKTKSLEMLMRHFGQFNDTLRVVDAGQITDRLNAGRKCIAADRKR